MSRRGAPAARPAPPWIDPDANCRWTPAAPGADGSAADDDLVAALPWVREHRPDWLEEAE